MLLNRGSVLLAGLGVSLLGLLMVLPGETDLQPAQSTWAIVGLACVAAAWRNGPYTLRAVLVILVFFVGEVECLLRLGYVVDTTVMAMSTFVVTGLLLGPRWAIAAWAASAMLLFAGIAFVGVGIVLPPFDPILVDPRELRTGVRFGLIYSGISGLVAIGVWFMASRLSTSLSETHAALSDVIEQQAATHEAEEARARSEEQWRAVVDGAADLIFNVDRDHRIEFINRAPPGFTIEQITGEPAERFVDEGYASMTRRKIDYVFETGRPTEYDAPAPTGDHEMWFTTRLSPIMQNGEVRGVSLIATDVTERRNLEAQLRQSQKLEAIGQLTGGVAHDFNNLLTVILGNLELAADELESTNPTQQLMASASEAAQRGAALMQRLLAFSRKQALRPCAVDLPGLLGDMRDLLTRTLGETVQVELEGGVELWRCEADPAQLESAILNLAINARDAMSGGGILTIETANVSLDDAYVEGHEEVAAGEYVMLAASDTGTGMAPDVLQMAFDPFFTTKQAGQGTGLGLSTVYGFVRQSRGHVSIDSVEGKGTSVRVYLPRSVRVDEGALVSAEPDGEPRGNGELVLVVEDDPEVRSLSVRLLETLGYLTVQASDAASALAALDEHREIALLFTDVVLPGGASGADLARVTQRRRPDLGVLFTSGYTQDAITDQGRLAPGAVLIEKPFNRGALAREVRAVLRAKPV
jgi:PAS domain S-box-containing protein